MDTWIYYDEDGDPYIIDDDGDRQYIDEDDYDIDDEWTDDEEVMEIDAGQVIVININL